MAEQTMNNEGDLPDNSGPQGGGYCIKIYVGADQSISVAKDPASPEDQGKGTPASSIDEAMALAMEMYEGGGDEDFDEGYGPEKQAPMMVRVREGE